MAKEEHPFRIGFLIHDVQRLMRKRFEARASGLGLSSAQWRLLVRVAKEDGVAQARLAELLEIEPISVSRLVDRMEEFGWVERRRSTEDRRRQGLFLTAAGTKACRALRKEMIDHERKFVDRYTDQELRTLIALLRRLHDVD